MFIVLVLCFEMWLWVWLSFLVVFIRFWMWWLILWVMM